jgi:integrase
MRAERYAAMRARRKTQVQPSQVDRAKADAKRKPGDRYTTCSYGQAVRKACLKAGIEPWHPHQLRHSAGTRIRREAGLETARVVLGHSSVAMTELYAEADRVRAAEIMGRIG